MSRHKWRYQRYRSRQWSTSAHNPGDTEALVSQIAAAANCPIYETLVPAQLFETGIGNLVFSRSLPDGRIALGGFLLDVFCLGVKDAFVSMVSSDQYTQRRRSWSSIQSLEPIEPACFRKLVEGAVAYARDLGFSPHKDYAVVSQIFGDVDAAACPMQFEYGREGKPFYVSGPHETATQVEAILDQLEQRVGTGNFHYIVLAQ